VTGRMDTTARMARSHVKEDGSPKVVFATEEEAAREAAYQRSLGRVVDVYLCWQRPDHWHLGAGRFSS
jgi:hypothetical protein